MAPKRVEDTKEMVAICDVVEAKLQRTAKGADMARSLARDRGVLGLYLETPYVSADKIRKALDDVPEDAREVIVSVFRDKERQGIAPSGNTDLVLLPISMRIFQESRLRTTILTINSSIRQAVNALRGNLGLWGLSCTRPDDFRIKDDLGEVVLSIKD